MRIVFFLAIILLVSCNESDKKNEATSTIAEEVKDPKVELSEKIAALEGRVYDKTKQPVQSDYLELKTSYKEFGDKFPNDENAAHCYFKSAELAQALGDYSESISLYKQIATEYPDYEKRVTSLFFVAFINHYFTKNFDEAKKYYQIVADEYPGTQEALDSEASIPLIGMTDEEIIKSFEQKNAK